MNWPIFASIVGFIVHSSSAQEISFNFEENFADYFTKNEKLECGNGDHTIFVIGKKLHSSDIQILCKGNLIHPNAALVPAQCVDKIQPPNIKIMLLSNETIENRTIINKHIHPSYDNCYGNSNFAILTFNPEFGEGSGIICLPNKFEIYAGNVNSCFVFSENFSNKREAECSWMLSHDFDTAYHARNIKKFSKNPAVKVIEFSYSRLIYCNFTFNEDNYTFIYSIDFYAFYRAKNENEYYVVQIQNYVEDVLNWIQNIFIREFKNEATDLLMEFT